MHTQPPGPQSPQSPFPATPPPPQPGVPGSGARGSGDDQLWAVLSYVLAFVASVIAPLVIYLVKMNESRYIRFHAAQALNLGLTFLIYWLALLVAFIPAVFATHGVGLLIIVPLMAALAVAHVIFLILAAVRAGQGQLYQVPAIICFRMVR